MTFKYNPDNDNASKKYIMAHWLKRTMMKILMGGNDGAEICEVIGT